MKCIRQFNNTILFNNDLEIEIIDNISSCLGIRLKSKNTVILGFLNAGDLKTVREPKLIIKYIERYSASGQLPGAANLEENVYSQKNSIIEKHITRQISPLLKKNNFDVEINILLESADYKFPSDALSMNCAMILCYISGLLEIPYYAGRFCVIDSHTKIEPEFKDIKNSKFTAIFGTTQNKIIFLEVNGIEFSEFEIENVLRKIEKDITAFFEILNDLKKNVSVKLGVERFTSNEKNDSIKNQIEKIVTENRELLEGIYVYDTYKMRISELTKLSSILLKNVELTVDLNNDVYTDVKKFYYDCFLKMIVKIVKEKLTQKKRLYNDYMNKLTGIDVEIIKNRNTAVCRINREITDTVVSVTSLITEKRIFKENDRTENIPNVKLEKFIKKTDDVDSKKENKFYNISNFFGNNINVMLGDRILPDEFKPLRSLQIETVLNKVVNYKNLFSQENVYRMVTEYISSDGCEISSPVNAVNILKYYHPVNFFKDIFFGDIVCLEFAYLIEENYLILEPVFLEETAADLRICIAGDSNNIKFMNLVTNTSGIEISKLTKIIKECKTILKNYLRTVVSNMNKNKNNLCYSIRF